MSGQEPDNNNGRQFFERTTFYDRKNDLDVRMYFNLCHIFHEETDPTNQLLLMSRGIRPYDIEGKRMHVHHINQDDHTDGGQFIMLTNRLHNIKQLHNSKEEGTRTSIERVGFRRVSCGHIRTLFLDIMEGRFRHPAVTEAVLQAFLARHGNQYHKAANFAAHFQSVPRPGGIEVLTLDNTSPNTPVCRNLHVGEDGK
ncbi:hypothetical protein BGW39_007870 [Mortierella sp. 14UC]|nr:hypothetical protein BGW39_007870 [Mortierella sp. 14UC]